MRIEHATAADAETISGLVQQLRAAEKIDGILGDAGILDYLNDPDTEVFLARKDDVAVGMLSVRAFRDLFHAGTSALVQELIVDEEHRGTGVAGSLLDAAIDWARERGCLEIGVTTGANNNVAQALYRSRGFSGEGVYLERHLS